MQEKGSITAHSYGERLRMAHAIMTLTQPQATSLDWKEIVADLGPRDFVYYDPPYANCKVGSYRADDLDHEELVEELLKAPYKWMLSEYQNPIYERLGEPFWRKEVQLRTTNFRADGGQGRRVECLWRNY